jgi:hypothetical protein
MEALIALLVAALVVSAGIEASSNAARRIAIAALDTEATAKAASLLAAMPTSPASNHYEGADETKGIRWRLDLKSDDAEFGRGLMDATAVVRISRNGLATERSLSELKRR